MTRKFCSRQIQKHSAAEFIHQLLAPISAQDALFWNTSFIRNIFRAGIGETLKCFFFFIDVFPARALATLQQY